MATVAAGTRRPSTGGEAPGKALEAEQIRGEKRASWVGFESEGAKTSFESSGNLTETSRLNLWPNYIILLITQPKKPCNKWTITRFRGRRLL